MARPPRPVAARGLRSRRRGHGAGRLAAAASAPQRALRSASAAAAASAGRSGEAAILRRLRETPTPSLFPGASAHWGGGTRGRPCGSEQPPPLPLALSGALLTGREQSSRAGKTRREPRKAAEKAPAPGTPARLRGSPAAVASLQAGAERDVWQGAGPRPSPSPLWPILSGEAARGAMGTARSGSSQNLALRPSLFREAPASLSFLLGKCALNCAGGGGNRPGFKPWLSRGVNNWGSWVVPAASLTHRRLGL